MAQQMVLGEDFVLSNLQGLAICSAMAKDVEFTELEERLFGGMSENIMKTTLGHNVRSSYIAAGVCILYSTHNRVSGSVFC